jgi:hypothetical protein
VLVLLAAAVPLAGGLARPPGRAAVLVVRAGDVETRLEARRDADLPVDGPQGRTLVRLRGGAAWIAAAPCRNQLCRRQGRLTAAGRSLVCVPNRVVVRFEGTGDGVDAIAR